MIAVGVGIGASVASADTRAVPPTTPLSNLTTPLWAGTTAGGMNITAAQGEAGVRGTTATKVFHLDTPISDRAHVELAGRSITYAPDDDPVAGSEHGLSSASVLVGKTIGIVPNAPLTSSATKDVETTNTVDGHVADNLGKVFGLASPPSAGDVLTYEGSVSGDDSNGHVLETPSENYGPLYAAHTPRTFWDEVRAATDLGVIVLEAAGNGDNGQNSPPVKDQGGNLDDPKLSANMRNPLTKDSGGTVNSWSSTINDSGGIIVGAGHPAPGPFCDDGDGTDPDLLVARSRIDYSTFGSRVDVQAPGSCYPAAGSFDLATGLGAIRGNINTHDNYGWFSGTSQAVAVAGGVTSALVSAYRTRTGGAPSPDVVRYTLKRTATPQANTTRAPAGQSIGGLVNLAGAVADMKTAPDTKITGGPAAGSTTSSTRPAFTFQGQKVGGAFGLPAGVSYQCRVVVANPTFETLLRNPMDPFTDCGSSGTWSPSRDLASGAWEFQVRAKILDGKVAPDGVTPLPLLDATAATSKFTVSAGGVAYIDSGQLNALAITSTATSLTLRVVGANIQIDDPNTITAKSGGGCTQSTTTRVLCPSSAITSAYIAGGAGSDTLDANIPVKSTLVGGPGNDTLISTGAGADVFQGLGGTDTVDYSTVSTAVNLSVDNVPDDGPAANANDNVKTDIEAVKTGPGNDRIVGSNVGPTAITAGAGDDFISSGYANMTVDPGAGNDTIEGGPGIDTIDYSASTNPLTVDYPNHKVTGAAEGTDTLARDNIEVIRGGSGNDTFTDGPGIQRFYGNAGNDRFTMTAGPITYVDDHGVTHAVPGSAGDLVSGGPGDDTVIDGPGADSYTGDAGADLFRFGPGGGWDEVIGGADEDTADFSALTSAVSSSVADGTILAASTGGLVSLTQIDTIFGTPFNDTLVTDDTGMTLNGGGGNDSLTGGTGADILSGNAGTDTYSAGSGNDRVTALDSVAENVDCGAGTDTATLDTIATTGVNDNAVNCAP